MTTEERAAIIEAAKEYEHCFGLTLNAIASLRRSEESDGGEHPSVWVNRLNTRRRNQDAAEIDLAMLVWDDDDQCIRIGDILYYASDSVHLVRINLAEIPDLAKEETANDRP